MPNKILIYGENWVGTLPQLLYADLEKRKIKVDIFDHTDILPGIKKRTFFQKVKRRLFGSFYKVKINKRFLNTVKVLNPSIVIIVKGLHLDLETLKNIKEKKILLINWNPDDFYNMKNSDQELIENIPIYDIIASSRGHLFEKYYNSGAKNMLFLDWYYVPELHFYKGKEKTIKYSFVGSWSPYREGFIDKIGKSFTIYGGGWDKSSSSFKKNHKVNEKILTQKEMGSIFEQSVFNLNILTHENGDKSNLRFFEVPASGGLLVTERNEVASKYLEDREECFMYSSIDEIKEIFESDIDSMTVNKLGRKRILSDNHSFSDRVDKLLKYIDSNKGNIQLRF
jgi:spore maturation protein CgeB